VRFPDTLIGTYPAGGPLPASVSHDVTGPVFEFGDFRLDCGRFELARGGNSLRVERKPMELLILLVSRQGQLVTRAEIAQRLWSSEVFVDTEHGINTAIRKVRYLLRDDSEEPKFIQTVTGMGYRFVAPTISVGEPATNSPEAPPVEPAALDPGLAAETLAPPSTHEAPKKSHAVQIFVVARFVALTVAFIVMAIGPRQIAGLLHRDPNPPITSLAVIPLDNLSGDPTQEYFADGMTDELITMLAKDSNLRITSRTSVMQYKGARKPLPEIARALNVDAILEGSISRANGQVHMTLQLLRADTDAHVWAESYDRGANDVAVLPGEAARAIADRLHSASTRQAQPRYVNPVAHDAYLQGRYLWFANASDASLPYFKKATELQPDYALAWAGLSAYYGGEAMFGGLDPSQALPMEESTARKCMQLDPSEAECHLSMAGAYLLSRWNLGEALNETSRATELDPKNAEAWELRSRILQALNRYDEAVQAEKTSIELNPSSEWGLMLALWTARRYDKALTDVRQRIVATPNDPTLQLFLASCYRGKGMDKESIQALEKFYRYSEGPSEAVSLHRAFESGGVRAAVEWQINFAKARATKHYVSPVDLAELYAQLGDRANTLAYLDEAYQQHASGLLWIQADSAYDFLHSDQRYRSLIQRMGLPPAY
jgi:TolB-like protein/DNA-binding winged helix-turn-helix (wHTH) protein/lipoprotein NlpI